MANSLLVIISGAPCTGKTTLAQRIATELKLPLISKDGFKEILLNRLGWKDVEWSRRMGQATYDLLYYVAAIQLQVGHDLVLEANFKAAWANQQFKDLQRICPFRSFQILLTVDKEVLLARFKQRTGSGKRHPGHIDHLRLKELAESLDQGDYEALDIGGVVWKIDTTDFAAVDYEALFHALKAALRVE